MDITSVCIAGVIMGLIATLYIDWRLKALYNELVIPIEIELIELKEKYANGRQL